MSKIIKNMKVIFIQNVKGKGQIGEIKEVHQGYAQNFLFPKQMARPATKQTLQTISAKKKKKENKKKQYKKWVKQLPQVMLRFKRKADENGTLFGSVNIDDICKELKKQSYNIDKNYIYIDSVIKKLGEYTVNLDFGDAIKSHFKVIVEKEL